MQEVGVNTGLFSPYGCRSAATSKADASSTSITTILQSASWSEFNRHSAGISKPKWWR